MKLTPWGSFEGWSDLVRRLWCGWNCPTPDRQRTELAAQSDREAVALRQLIAGWEEVDFTGSGMTVASVLRELAEHPTCYDTLRGALSELAPPKDGRNLNARSIGAKMHHLRRRVVCGKYLDRRDTNQGAVWKIRGSDSSGSSDSILDSARTGDTHGASARESKTGCRYCHYCPHCHHAEPRRLPPRLGG